MLVESGVTANSGDGVDGGEDGLLPDRGVVGSGGVLRMCWLLQSARGPSRTACGANGLSGRFGSGVERRRVLMWHVAAVGIDVGVSASEGSLLPDKELFDRELVAPLGFPASTAAVLVARIGVGFPLGPLPPVVGNLRFLHERKRAVGAFSVAGALWLKEAPVALRRLDVSGLGVRVNGEPLTAEWGFGPHGRFEVGIVFSLSCAREVLDGVLPLYAS